MGAAQAIPTLLGIAVLLPLASFGLLVFFGPRLGPNGKFAGYVACAAIGSGFVLSVLSLWFWLDRHHLPAAHAVERHDEEHIAQADGLAATLVQYTQAGVADGEAAAHAAVAPPYLAGSWWPIYDSGGQLKLVQIYTIARRPAESFVSPLADAEVDRIVELVKDRTRLTALAYYGSSDY